jgi:hypothetical protein
MYFKIALRLEIWVKELLESADHDIYIILVGNKLD